MFILIQDEIINIDSVVTISKDCTGYNSTEADHKRLWKHYIKVKFNNSVVPRNGLSGDETYHYDSEDDRDKAFRNIKISMNLMIVKDFKTFKEKNND